MPKDFESDKPEQIRQPQQSFELGQGETFSPKLILQQLWIDLTGKIK